MVQGMSRQFQEAGCAYVTCLESGIIHWISISAFVIHPSKVPVTLVLLAS